MTQTFSYTAPIPAALLPVIGVLPLSPMFDPPMPVTQNEGLDYINYPTCNCLSISNLWSYLNPDMSAVIYLAEIFNDSEEPVVFHFVFSYL